MIVGGGQQHELPSQIFRPQASVFTDFGECGGSDFFVVVETEGEVGPPASLQLAMGADLFLQSPTKAQQCRVARQVLTRRRGP